MPSEAGHRRALETLSVMMIFPIFDGGLPLVGRRILHGDHDVLTPPKNAEIALERPRTCEKSVF